MSKTKRFATVAFFCISTLAITDIDIFPNRTISSDRRDSISFERDSQSVAAAEEAKKKTAAVGTAAIAPETEPVDRAPWIPPKTGEEAYRQRFESPEHRVISEGEKQLPPVIQPVQSSTQPAPFTPVPVAKILRAPQGRSRLALTFDTEKDEGSVVLILAALKKHNVKATFFIAGAWAYVYPDLLKRIADEGHEIANHAYSHPMLTGLTNEAIIPELVVTEQHLSNITKRSPARLFRPPYGACDDRILGLAASQGFQTILWSNDPSDWHPAQTPEGVVKYVMNNLGDGDIVLLHTSSISTGAALPTLLEKLTAAGYAQVTVSDALRP